MADSKTNCPKCGGHIAFPKELAGQATLCPHCNENILLPKCKPPIAWIMVAAFALVSVCLASILVWEHLTNRAVTSPPVRIVENTNSQAVVVQKDPLATGQLMSAAQYGGNAETVKLLLERGADVNAKDNDGWTPLQHAAKRGNVEIIKLLLEKGADVNAKSNDGVTALMSAAKRGYMEIIKLLLEKGADVNANFKGNGTALSLAAEAGQTNAVGFLLDKNANINATNWDGDTALMTAVEHGKIEVVKLLLARGADVNAANNNLHDTALLAAVEKGQTEVVKLLLARKANVNAEGFMGRNALDEAREKGNVAIVQLLQQAGATTSSAAARDEAMSKNLHELEQSHAALSNSLQKFQQASAIATEASYKPTFEVLNVTSKVTEQTDTWWRFGYRLTVRNNGINTDGQWFEIQFLDAEGYVIDTTHTHQTVIKPGTTEIITGDALIDLPGAARVSKLKAISKQ